MGEPQEVYEMVAENQQVESVDVVFLSELDQTAPIPQQLQAILPHRVRFVGGPADGDTALMSDKRLATGVKSIVQEEHLGVVHEYQADPTAEKPTFLHNRSYYAD